MLPEYYLGLDVGTNSVGYAVTDESYRLLKFRNEPMWGAHVFDEALPAADRRMKRTGKRRLQRRQRRVLLVQEIFAHEIARTDERFFVRLQEATRFRDELSPTEANILFNDADFHDKDYYGKYPTIHHLLMALIGDKVPTDTRYARLVYLAVGWLVAHRGHFLSDVDKDNFQEVLDFHGAYREFLGWMEKCGLQPWDCNEEDLQQELLKESRVRDKEKALGKVLYGGKAPKASEDAPVDEGKLVTLLAGGSVKIKKLFPAQEYEEDANLSFRDSEDDLEKTLALLGDESECILRLRKLYDWSLLKEILGGSSLISEGKVAIYRQHREDLANLKRFIRSYLPEKYSAVFRSMSFSEEKNYVAYSYHWKGQKRGILPKEKAKQQEFCDYLKKLCKDVKCRPADEAFYADMMSRLEQGTFMPKQVSGENRVIPYQLYYHELKMILEQAEKHLPFLLEQDADGYTAKEKLLSIFLFRIPYFVGPLHFANRDGKRSPYAWVERKGDLPVRPWNFREMIDFEKSEEGFIRRMTNTCTYWAGAAVLPQNSLLYEKFMVLNELNNLRINGAPISVEAKQSIYHALLEDKRKGRKVTQKAIREVLQRNKLFPKDGVLSGMDKELHAGLNSRMAFARLLDAGTLSEKDAERILERLAYTEDRRRIRVWLAQEFPQLGEEDIRYLSKLSSKGFGRLSREFLEGFEGVCKETEEKNTILGFLWESNDNLMQLLSERYTFKEELEAHQKTYYREHPMKLEERMEDMRLSSAVKRAIYRTLDIVREVCKARKQPPKRIFIEMARGGGEKGARTISRREQIKKLYADLGDEFQQDVRELSAQLEGTSDSRLQSKVAYLYFLQLGKSMYSGKPIQIDQLKDDKLYNIDHIYPRSVVKDDSLDNMVLVTSKENSDKGSQFPIQGEIHDHMAKLWKAYRRNHLISEEKYHRLTRRTGFTAEERWGFIHRQLVETRQSTKALASILQERYPQTKIVYTKAGMVSEFRQEFKLVKCRSANDLHHAKDAYLNIVVGNVYSLRFRKELGFQPTQEYSVKLKTLFGDEVKAGGQTIWRGGADLGHVRKTLGKNHAHYTKFAFIRKGGFFKENPNKAQAGLVPRKRGLDPARYGGYNKPTASFYLLVRYVLIAKKREPGLMLVPVELLSAERVRSSEEAARDYAQNAIAQILEKDVSCVTEISFPLGQRPIKINAVLSFDGYRACLSGKNSKGKRVLFTSAMPLCLDTEKERYVKRLESFQLKAVKNKNLEPDEQYDKISTEQNRELYKFFCEKMASPLFQKAVFSNQMTTLSKGREKFETLSLREQALALLSVLSIFKTGRGSECDLSLIGGSRYAGTYVASASLRNLAKNFRDIRLIETSASGLYTSSSRNLLEFL